MAASPWLAGAQIGMGLLGLGQQSAAQRAQQRYLESAARVNDMKFSGLSESLKRARAYDPRSEDAASANYATSAAGDALGKSLSSLNQQFGAAAGNDSLFRVRAQGATNRIVDPLKEWLANQRSTETARKVGMIGSALGQGGDIAGNYMALASSSTPDFSGASQMLTSGLQGFLPKEKPNSMSTKNGDKGVNTGITIVNPLKANDYSVQYDYHPPGRSWR